MWEIEKRVDLRKEQVTQRRLLFRIRSNVRYKIWFVTELFTQKSVELAAQLVAPLKTLWTYSVMFSASLPSCKFIKKKMETKGKC